MLLVLLVSFLIAAHAATTGQTLPPACTLTSPANCVKGRTCVAGGCCVAGSPANQCSGCPYCCRVQNPTFSKQCALNTVLILDNTKSLDPYCSSVKPAVASFVNGLNNIVNAGGSVHLGVLLFKENPFIVWDMTPVTPTFLTSVQNWIGTSTTNGGTVTGVFPTGTQVQGYCLGTGFTNWAAALYLAAQWPWNGFVVDIHIWFTDGFPEFSANYFPQTSCASTCYSNGNAFFSDICSATTAPCTLGCGGAGVSCVADTQARPGNAEGTWTACSAADALKATGSKLFLVGVGLVQGHENEIQLVTGTRAWDGTPATFGTSDYIISASFGSLSQLFLETILGLCACLQAQPACLGGGSCNAISFSAITRITTTAASTSTTLPPLSVLVATIYYDYQPSPKTQIAWAFYPTSAPVTQQLPVTPIRTDLQLPCAVQRQITCSSSGCLQITETKLIPRFFHESTDTAGCGAGPFSVLTPPPAGTCSCFTKHYASPPYGATVPEMVQYIWVYNSDSTTPCAAQAYDGTFYEFFKDTVPTMGVTLGVPTFPVSQSTSCTTPQCGSNVELVFVLDQQSACTTADWTAINYFTLGVIGSFPVSGATRFGVVYAGQPASAWPSSTLLSTSLATWQNYLGCPTPTCTTTKSPSHIPVGGASTDFAAAINLALTTFWPSSVPATGVKRELLTYVCGPSSSSAAAISAMQTNLANAGVERWTIGVDQGTTSVTTLAALSSSNGYVHYIAVPLSAALPNQQALENQLLCPQTNLCGINCLGICTCSTPSALSCVCPPCASTFCNPASCPSSTTGCLAGTPNSCNDNNACTVDSCNLVTQACVHSAISCSDSSACTSDSCNPGSGCVYTPIQCSDGNACTVDSCAPATGCTHTPLVCTSGSACVTTSCSTSSGCIYTPVSCTDSDACTSDSCNPQSGCVHTPITCTSPDLCHTSSCSSSSGCIYTPVPCADDGNICTSDACSPATGTCVHSTIAGCSLCGVPATCAGVTPNGCQIKSCLESGTTAATLALAHTECDAIVNYVSPTYSATACKTALATFSPPTAYCFLQDVSASLCPSTTCVPNTCSGAGVCNPIPLNCADADPCTVDACVNPGGCTHTPIVCIADACNTNSCNASGVCNPQPISCDDANPCTVDTCVVAGGVGCVHTPIVCTGDACNTNSCVGGQCVPVPIVCDDKQPCTSDSCSIASGGCIYTPVVCEQVASCFPTSCQSDGALPVPSPVCVTSTVQTPCPVANTPCVTQECRQGVGCVAVNKTCSSTTDCNFPVGCDAATGTCLLKNITSLIDFCGVCLGDSASCFFSSVYPVSNIAVITGGAIAGIVIACIIAAALFFWLSKKGYDYYKAQGDLSSHGMKNNPAFKSNDMSGVNIAE